MNNKKQYQGAIDYLILKFNNKYTIIFLDDHSPEHYCDKSTKSENIDILFETFINKRTTFIFEELLDDIKYISLFEHSEHLVGYLQFYNKNKKEINFFPVDLRIIFNDLDNSNLFNTIEIFFNIFGFNEVENDEIENEEIKINEKFKCKNEKFFFIIKQIKKVLIKTDNIKKIYIKHLYNLYKKFIKIKNVIESDSLIKELFINENQNKFYRYIYLDYPFNTSRHIDITNISEEYNDLLSGLLEFYTITIILNSHATYNILYLGASHCILIFNLLHKYYNFKICKKFNNFDLELMETFDLENFNNKKSCIIPDFTSIDI